MLAQARPRMINHLTSKDKVWSRVSVLCSYCQLVEVQEVSEERKGLVKLPDLSHQDRVLQTSLQRHTKIYRHDK